MARRLELSGQRFGKLLVLSPALAPKGKATRWLCQCDCGNTKTVLTNSLTMGKATTCGCSGNVFKDETGNTYNRLTAIRRAENTERGQAQWLCKCECGNITTVSGYNLRNGHIRSCGCLHTEAVQAATRKYSREDSTWMSLYRSHCQSKDTRGCLSYEYWKQLSTQNCVYCGQPPEEKVISTGDPVYANGIDRFINALGYQEDNCVPCCGMCNYRKGTMDGIEYSAYLIRVAKYLQSIGVV